MRMYQFDYKKADCSVSDFEIEKLDYKVINMDKDLVKFKNVLEYFVAHQNYVQSNSELAAGYEKYIKPYIDSKTFCYTGQGYSGDRIQEQIGDWEIINNHQICINIQPNFGDYTSKKSYLNWIETGLNIFCKWTNSEVESLSIGHAYWWYKPTMYKLLLTYTTEELGLFKENEYTQKLNDFYNLFVNEIDDYDNHKGVYYLKLQEYYKKVNDEKNMEKNMKYRNILDKNYNLILTGAPGTGKTYLAKQIAAQMILGKEYDENVASEKEKMEEQYDFVQFHPSYDYTDFVEGLRPIDDGTGNISFHREDGIFMDFCRRALKAYNNATDKENAPKYVFVIDEINRGELSKIFGELFFCIDPGYRGEDGKVKTQYNNLWKEDKFDDSDFFFIPKNVYIIGTMNDIDRSVESMDFAMRRRFAFREVKASDNIEMLKNNKLLSKCSDAIIERMNNLNNAILDIQGFSKAYQIGAAYFLKLENYLTDDGEVCDDSWIDLWNNHLYGLLFEYLRGLPNAKDELKKLCRAYGLPDNYAEI